MLSVKVVKNALSSSSARVMESPCLLKHPNRTVDKVYIFPVPLVIQAELFSFVQKQRHYFLPNPLPVVARALQYEVPQLGKEGHD
jgi:hypothetical protein